MSDKYEINLSVDGFHSLNMVDREVAYYMAVRKAFGMTVKDVADKVGISRERIYQIESKRGYKDFQNYVFEQVMSQLMGKAVVELDKLLDESKSPSMKLKVIQTILSAGGKMGNHQTITVRTEPASQEERERKIIEMENELLGEGEMDNE